MQPRREEGILAAIFSNETYTPTEPSTIDATGLPISLIENLICKRLSVVGTSSGRKLADDVCLPFRILEDVYNSLRSRQIIVHRGSAPLNDYNYTLTERGRAYAHTAMESCAYVGPAPVPLIDYVLSTEAQTISAESPKRSELRKAFKSITVDENLFESLGPAINSGAGLFLYGEPGNGKSTLAKRITMCFGQEIWIPHAIFEDGQIIKLFDAAFHESANGDADGIIKSAAYDPRWIKIRRPTVVVGGELTIDSLEIRHDPKSNVSEASLQMKSNCGCLLIDDFGRQRIRPEELLNRWIVPLESRVDYLTLSTGKKIQVPFEQLIIFSTNLEPSKLVDEAFLRRIPYKIEIGDPSVAEFQTLFQLYGRSLGFEYRPDVVQYLIQTHYEKAGRCMRRCHPRDLLSQIRNYCVYNELPLEMRQDYFDRVVNSYFTDVLGKNKTPTTPAPVAYQEPFLSRKSSRPNLEAKKPAAKAPEKPVSKQMPKPPKPTPAQSGRPENQDRSPGPRGARPGSSAALPKAKSAQPSSASASTPRQRSKPAAEATPNRPARPAPRKESPPRKSPAPQSVDDISTKNSPNATPQSAS